MHNTHYFYGHTAHWFGVAERYKKVARKKKTERYVYITDRYRFYIDYISKTLECKTDGKWKTVGYFTRLEPMMKHIAQLETDNQIECATIAEYIKILQAENEKIHVLFEALGIA